MPFWVLFLAVGRYAHVQNFQLWAILAPIQWCVLIKTAPVMKTDRLSILQWLATATGGGWQFSTDGIFMTQTGPNGAISGTPDHPTTFDVQPVVSTNENVPVT